MASLSTQTTYSAKPKDIQRAWHLIDVSDKVLGRTPTRSPRCSRASTSPMYTPCMDTGDSVIVINAAKVKLTGTKEVKKKYYRTRCSRAFPAHQDGNYAALKRHPEDRSSTPSAACCPAARSAGR